MSSDINECIKKAVEGENLNKKAAKKILEKKGQGRVKKVVQYAIQGISNIMEKISSINSIIRVSYCNIFH